jgi:hypothetical protein
LSFEIYMEEEKHNLSMGKVYDPLLSTCLYQSALNIKVRRVTFLFKAGCSPI